LFANTTNWGIYYAKLSDLGITSVEEQNLAKSDKCFIFPNPSTDYISLNAENLEPMSEIVVYDVMGNEINPPRPAGTPQEGNKYRIDISTLPAGVYFVRIENEKPMKFVKM
jgi:hypothetical protein